MKVVKNEQGNYDIFREEDVTDAATGESLKINKKVFNNLTSQNIDNHLKDAQETVALWQEIKDKSLTAE